MRGENLRRWRLAAKIAFDLLIDLILNDGFNLALQARALGERNDRRPR